MVNGKRQNIFVALIISALLLTFSIQAQDIDAQKLLLDSISCHQVDVSGVRNALDKGADPNWTVKGSRMSVIVILAGSSACATEEEGAEGKSIEILQMLFGAGAKLRSSDQEALYFVIATGWVHFAEILLKNGASPINQIEGKTPMEIAASYGQKNSIELLKKYGASPLERNVAAQFRLNLAAAQHDITAMGEAIRSGADVNGTNRQGETALVNAFSIITAFETKGYLCILYLLDQGADPTIQGQQSSFGKTTALHRAIWQSSLIFDKEIKNESLKNSPIYARRIIESLIRHGAHVSARDNNGMTPLHIAAERNNIVGAKMLIEAGSKIMPKDNKGKTPLDYAESAEMIKLLKEHGAKEE